MKLLIHSNAPYAPTGYGNQVGLFAPRLKDHHEVAISCFYGLEGNGLRWEGIRLLPGLGGEFGNDYLREHARNVFEDDPRAGVVMTLMDVWVLQAEKMSELNLCSWVPVDHDPAPPMVTEFFATSHSVPLAMSRFGEERLKEFDPIYVPHGVDLDTYKPHDQAEVREHFDLDPDAFIVGMVAANKGNPSRKGFQQAFQAFREFQRSHEDAYLYLHTDMAGDQFSQGEDLPTLLASLEIPEERVLIANQYRIHFSPAPAKMMAKLYSAFDVFLNPAMGEGFGIPIVEAQACGIPTIVSDFSAMKETGCGWKIPCDGFWTPQKSWQAIPRVAEIHKALEEVHALDDMGRKVMADKARAHVRQYEVGKVLKDHLLPALDEVEERLLKPKAPSVPAKVIA